MSTLNTHQNTKHLVAFIDDNGDIRDEVVILMEHYGFESKTYASRAAFIADLDSNLKLDCIVLDLHLPDINGIDLMQELLNRNIHTPVIILSADVSSPLAIQAVELGAVKVLEKPTIPEELINKIHEIISS